MHQPATSIQQELDQFVSCEPAPARISKPFKETLDDIALTSAEVLAIRRTRQERDRKRTQEIERLKQWLQEKKKT